MGVATSSKMHLTGSNELWFELIYNQAVSGTTNAVSVTMRVRTRWAIQGTWSCQLSVNGQNVGPQSCYISHGSYSVENSGYTDVLSKTVWINYTGNKSINLTAIIYNMDYQDIFTGAYGVFNPSFSTTIPLNYITPPNSAPPTPTLSIINNTKYNSNYITENYFTASLSSVSDPNGDAVRYVIYCDKKAPGSNSWVSNGDANHCVLWTTESRQVNINTVNDARGTQYKVWGKTEDTKGASSGYTNTITNIYKNYAPSNTANIYPNKSNFYTDVLNISWDAATDYENMPLTYTVSVSKNGGSYVTIAKNISNKNVTYNATNDALNTTYVFKVVTNDVYTSSTGKTSIKYIKTDNTPTAPKGIEPSSGFYYGEVILSWKASTNPTGNGIYKYNVYINDEFIGSSTSTQYKWKIPNNDAEGTSYKVSVEAISQEGIIGKRGYAYNSFKKALSPIAPAYILPNEIYHNSAINLVWYKVTSNNIACEYIIDYKVNSGNWINLGRISANSYVFSLDNLNRGDGIQFRIKSINSFSLSSEYKYSIVYYKNVLPDTPIIDYPVNNSTLFQTDPRLAIIIPKKTSNQSLKLVVNINGVSYDTEKNPEYFSRKEKYFNADTRIIFKADKFVYGKNIVKLYLNDGVSNSQVSEFVYTIKEFKIDELNNSEVFITENIFKSISNNINLLNEAFKLNKLDFSINKNEFIYFEIINKYRNSIEIIRNTLNNYDNTNKEFDAASSWHESSINSFIEKKIIVEIIENIKNL